LETPDAFEKKVRFGCGFVFGMVASGLSATVLLVANGYYYAGLIVLSGLVYGVLAMRYGDRFWSWLRYWVW